jgi:transcriptional regulator with XRE-family HTH domain
MGRASRRRHMPVRIGEKFLKIRTAFNLTQQRMLERLNLPDEVTQSNISAYERGTKEPPIFVLIKYAEIANVWIDVLVKDSLDLPERLPAHPKSEGLNRKNVSKLTLKSTITRKP